MIGYSEHFRDRDSFHNPRAGPMDVDRYIKFILMSVRFGGELTCFDRGMGLVRDLDSKEKYYPDDIR